MAAGDQVAGGAWMVSTAARYQTVVTLFNPGPAGVYTVVKSNPQRWSLRFVATGGPASMPLIVPGPPFPALPTAQFSGGEQEWKYRDWPAAVIGDWVTSIGPGFNCLVVEQLYVGG